MAKYLVMNSEALFDILDEYDLAIIHANSSDEAFEKFCRNVGSKDPLFLHHLATDFYETFHLLTPEDEEAFLQGTLNITDEEFKQRVRGFFGKHQKYADLYLTYYFEDGQEAVEDIFPEEMIYFIFEKLIKKHDWMYLMVIPLDRFPEIR